MKRMISLKNFRLHLLFLMINLLLSFSAMSQPGDPGGDDDVPITGIEWLLVGGSIFGARKIYRRFKGK